jgi:hypothetical protein
VAAAVVVVVVVVNCVRICWLHIYTFCVLTWTMR